jgi:hypothetical protein
MSSPDGAAPSSKDPVTPHTRHELSPKLQMSIVGALAIQQFKACTVFSDKLAILGNLTGYQYRIHPGEAAEKRLGFSACVLAMALFNGDLGVLFSDDFAFTRDGVKTPAGLLRGETSLSRLTNERSAHSRNKGRIMAGNPCLINGGRLLVKAVLWRIVPFTLDGLENEIACPEEGINVRSKNDPIRFHFFQALVRRLMELGRMDILELVVTSAMRRQLASPLELVHILNELQAWFRNERAWPMGIADETYLETHPPPKGMEIVFQNGKKGKVREWVRDPNARGMDIAIARMEHENDGSDTEPGDILSHIHHAVMHGQPIALGTCEVEGSTLASIFTLDPCHHKWVLTPLDELDYVFGRNPWLHMFPKDAFWCCEKLEESIPDSRVQEAYGMLKTNLIGEERISDTVLTVTTTGARSSITGVWSPRLSRRGVLTIGEGGSSWETIPLDQGTMRPAPKISARVFPF